MSGLEVQMLLKMSGYHLSLVPASDAGFLLVQTLGANKYDQGTGSSRCVTKSPMQDMQICFSASVVLSE